MVDYKTIVEHFDAAKVHLDDMDHSYKHFFMKDVVVARERLDKLAMVVDQFNSEIMAKVPDNASAAMYLRTIADKATIIMSYIFCNDRYCNNVIGHAYESCGLCFKTRQSYPSATQCFICAYMRYAYGNSPCDVVRIMKLMVRTYTKQNISSEACYMAEKIEKIEKGDRTLFEGATSAQEEAAKAGLRQFTSGEKEQRQAALEWWDKPLIDQKQVALKQWTGGAQCFDIRYPEVTASTDSHF